MAVEKMVFAVEQNVAGSCELFLRFVIDSRGNIVTLCIENDADVNKGGRVRQKDKLYML